LIILSCVASHTLEDKRECICVEFSSSDENARLRRPESIWRFWYLLLPDDRTLSGCMRGSDGMLLSCVTIVGQRELPQSFERDRYEHIWTHAHSRSPIDIGSFWHSSYEVFEFNQLAHAFEMRPSRELALKARLTSNTIMAVIGRVDIMNNKCRYDT